MLPLEAQVERAVSTDYRIAILGCHRQFRPAPALVRYVESEPDLCLWIGDNIYADTQDDVEHLQKCYDALAAKPAFQQLYQKVPYMATWDDHDYGDNDESSSYNLKEESKSLFRNFWKLESEIPESRSGVYYAKILEIAGQKVQIIMLDVRYHRDEPGQEADMLGEVQWEWLGQELIKDADLRIIVSGTQVILDKESGSETWDEYPLAQKRLFDLIRLSQAEGVVFLTGDQHYGEVCRMPGMLDYDVVELQFSGINQTENPELNTSRVSTVSSALHSYALLDLQLKPDKYNTPHLLFQVFDAMTNQIEVLYRVNLYELRLKLEMTEDTAFAESKLVELRHNYPKLEVRYTIDGTDPDNNSPIYVAPVEITRTSVLKARFFDKQGFARSRVYSKTYEKLQLVESASVNRSKLKEGLHFEILEGEFQVLPDFKKNKAQRSGIAQNFEVKELSGLEDHYAIRFHGFIDIEETAVYTITTISDDGSALIIQDRKVVDNDGSHSKRARSGKVYLEKGLHSIEILYFEDYAGERLDVMLAPADRPAEHVSFKNLYYK